VLQIALPAAFAVFVLLTLTVTIVLVEIVAGGDLRAEDLVRYLILLAVTGALGWGSWRLAGSDFRRRFRPVEDRIDHVFGAVLYLRHPPRKEDLAQTFDEDVYGPAFKTLVNERPRAVKGFLSRDPMRGYDVLAEEAEHAEAAGAGDAVARWRHLGILALYIDDDRALTAFRRVRALAPQDFIALDGLRRIYAAREQWAEAREAAAAANAVAPTAKDRHACLMAEAEAFLRLGERDAALGAYRRAAQHLGKVTRDPDGLRGFAATMEQIAKDIGREQGAEASRHFFAEAVATLHAVANASAEPKARAEVAAAMTRIGTWLVGRGDPEAGESYIALAQRIEDELKG
jgi:tetratricopeptide (TPR) repeat protein